MTDHAAVSFDWKPQPEAAALVAALLEEACGDCRVLTELATALIEKTGTRLIDWVDHFHLADDPALRGRLAEVGFSLEQTGRLTVWRHDAGMFPAIVLSGALATRRVAIDVESVADFLVAQGLGDETPIHGGPLAPLRMAKVADGATSEVWAIERHGATGFDPITIDDGQAAAVIRHSEAFWRRQRRFVDPADGFAHARGLIQASIEDLGVDRTCDLFFAAERRYWQRRNRAGRQQRARQDALGLGWANHDHHTYRSSRRWFADLIASLELLGFFCRERFYAGQEADWGAQVLEQSATGTVVFADVDMRQEEVVGDFSHEGLPPQDGVGTIGLWCALHGEAFLEAGLHHLECQFDYRAARDQLAAEAVESMPPFTDFDFLKQAFTQGEMWPVRSERLDAALSSGLIDEAQAERFRREGALGSHLEILERNDGYKGFNQTGISEIILKTDPRRQSVSS
ncbi:MAG: hypothetical protein IIA67_01050 [Planctomycetes bacterium]|nr:hypothetical protein [Planctomycetota bacterium]